MLLVGEAAAVAAAGGEQPSVTNRVGDEGGDEARRTRRRLRWASGISAAAEAAAERWGLGWEMGDRRTPTTRRDGRRKPRRWGGSNPTAHIIYHTQGPLSQLSSSSVRRSAHTYIPGE